MRREYRLKIADGICHRWGLSPRHSRPRCESRYLTIYFIQEGRPPKILCGDKSVCFGDVYAETEDHKPGTILRGAIMQGIHGDSLDYISVTSVPQCLLQLHEGRLLIGREAMTHPHHIFDDDNLRARSLHEL
ncbi:hypothetical protein ASF62_06275 [Leifsonia sp. Leaf325]|nr:hypothetical protein ASF62_06275 [Leifsonia sp. Leaf325]